MINDSVLEHEIFVDRDNRPDDFFTNIEFYLHQAGVEMPSFYTFKEVKPFNEISWSAEKGYTATGVEGSWDSMSELNDHIENVLGNDVTFHRSALKSPDVEDNLGGDMIFLKDKLNKGSARMLFSPPPYRALAHWHYYQFLGTARYWLENQTDMVAAYSFLESHPAFWSRHTMEHPDTWAQDKGLSGLWIDVSKRQDGSPIVMLEHGSAVEPERIRHYHDPRLDVYADSFEEAYIQLAKKVHEFFALDGSERPDTDYEPQPWEQEVQERLEKWKELNPEDENDEDSDKA